MPQHLGREGFRDKDDRTFSMLASPSHFWSMSPCKACTTAQANSSTECCAAHALGLSLLGCTSKGHMVHKVSLISSSLLVYTCAYTCAHTRVHTHTHTFHVIIQRQHNQKVPNFQSLYELITQIRKKMGKNFICPFHPPHGTVTNAWPETDLNCCMKVLNCVAEGLPILPDFTDRPSSDKLSNKQRLTSIMASYRVTKWTCKCGV